MTADDNSIDAGISSIRANLGGRVAIFSSCLEGHAVVGSILLGYSSDAVSSLFGSLVLFSECVWKDCLSNTSFSFIDCNHMKKSNLGIAVKNDVGAPDV